MTVGGPARPLSPTEVSGGFGGCVPDSLGLAQPGTNAPAARLTAAEVRDRTPVRLDEWLGRRQAFEEADSVNDPTAHDRQ